MLCVSILCIYINMARIMNQDIENIKADNVSIVQVEDELIIEDEPVPGGAAVETESLVKEEKQRPYEIEFCIVVLILIAISVKVISENPKQ